MAHDLDTLAVAIQLVNELGDDAATVAKIRLVELIAANNLRAASFWRDVLRASEDLLAQKLRGGGLAQLVAEAAGEDDEDDVDSELEAMRGLTAVPAATVH